MLTGGKVSLSAYIDNVLAQHFEQYREEIEVHTPGNWRTSFKKKGGNGMILKLSLTVLLLYYLAVLWKYYRQDIAGMFGTAETDEARMSRIRSRATGRAVHGHGRKHLPAFGAEDGRKRQPEPWTNPPRRTTGRTTPTSSRRRTRRRRTMNPRRRRSGHWRRKRN